ncbi:hypothetical protein L596_002865 [Steinernema carpocapsae]|uniref:Tyrosine-protein phosphatase domain-containing protein n=1 Tax=Steinernema carpocapsae TaxID=34508 RepID=A0A4U8UUK4_STECR|nr:hypothetical protein L596_002865 [Steinernema carpocapsae]
MSAERSNQRALLFITQLGVRIRLRTWQTAILDSGPALVTSVVSAVHTVTRRLEFTRSHSRTLACTRSTSAHPTVSVTCSKAAPIRVLSLAHSIPETEGDERKEEKDTLFKKRSRSASFIESRRADTPRQLLAFMFSGTTKFANDSKWTCAAGIHRILVSTSELNFAQSPFQNLTGVPISPAANCQCREESLQKKHRKQELILNIDYRTSPKKIAASFTQVNSFIARARSAASNILVCHRPDHVEYCMAFVVQYIIVYHDIPLNRALGHCRALQNFDIPLNAIEALKIWEKTKSYPPETLNQVTPLPATRSDDFKWVEVRRPVKLAWC